MEISRKPRRPRRFKNYPYAIVYNQRMSLIHTRKTYLVVVACRNVNVSTPPPQLERWGSSKIALPPPRPYIILLVSGTILRESHVWYPDGIEDRC